MNQTTEPTHQNFADELALLAAAFTETQNLLTAGHAVDLSGLDGQINDFCERMLASDNATKQSLLPALAGLLVQLEQLEAQLRRLQEAHGRTRASTAYGTSDKQGEK
jgi:hypothetical protein